MRPLPRISIGNYKSIPVSGAMRDDLVGFVHTQRCIALLTYIRRTDIRISPIKAQRNRCQDLWLRLTETREPATTITLLVLVNQAPADSESFGYSNVGFVLLLVGFGERAGKVGGDFSRGFEFLGMDRHFYSGSQVEASKLDVQCDQAVPALHKLIAQVPAWLSLL